jgi:hypothetical protein
MDVNIDFINGYIEEEVYIMQPDGFLIHGKESHVCKLKKAMYGLKQEPQDWYVNIYGYLMSLSFRKSVVDSNLYYNIFYGEFLILILSIDDLFLIGEEGLIAWWKYELSSKFEMNYLGMIHYFLGL